AVEAEREDAAGNAREEARAHALARRHSRAQRREDVEDEIDGLHRLLAGLERMDGGPAGRRYDVRERGVDPRAHPDPDAARAGRGAEPRGAQEEHLAQELAVRDTPPGALDERLAPGVPARAAEEPVAERAHRRAPLLARAGHELGDLVAHLPALARARERRADRDLDRIRDA